MGKVWMPGGSVGADIDAVTAEQPDILAGKVIVDKDGEPLIGTMPNHGAVNQSLGINGAYTIPEGYHNGLGKVTQSVVTMGGQTINPGASQQTVSTSGKYMTGDVIVSGVSNLSAGNVKKGVNIGGIVGTWEGYVPGAQDLYYYGNNISGFTSSSGIQFQAGQLRVPSGAQIGLKSGVWVNLVGKSQLLVQGVALGTRNNVELRLHVSDIWSTWFGNIVADNGFTASFPLSALQTTEFLDMRFMNMSCTITRIWLT